MPSFRTTWYEDRMFAHLVIKSGTLHTDMCPFWNPNLEEGDVLVSCYSEPFSMMTSTRITDWCHTFQSVTCTYVLTSLFPTYSRSTCATVLEYRTSLCHCAYTSVIVLCDLSAVMRHAVMQLRPAASRFHHAPSPPPVAP